MSTFRHHTSLVKTEKDTAIKHNLFQPLQNMFLATQVQAHCPLFNMSSSLTIKIKINPYLGGNKSSGCV